MGKLGEMLGRLDDRSVIYRTDDPEQRVSWKRALVAPAMIAAILVAARAAGINEDMVIGVLGVLTIVFLPFYVVWRRRRNKRMTGSATTWPSE